MGFEPAAAARYADACVFQLVLRNDSGGGQLGNAIHCKPHGPNDWIYVVVQEAVWEALAKRIGPEVHHPDLATDPDLAKIADRRRHQA